MKRIIPFLLIALFSSCSFKVSKPMLKMLLTGANHERTDLCYADSCVKKIGVQYVNDGTAAQVLDIYYADAAVRKNAVLIDIHGGFYVAGLRQNNRYFASPFLKEGYDVVLVEYRLNDGKLDVASELADCAAALDYITLNADELGLNKDRMFITGDSAGGHLALYMAEGSEDHSIPVHPEHFKAKGALLNCPAYNFAAFGDSDMYTKNCLLWFLGPRYDDKEWMKSMSPRTYLQSYSGPIFLSTCTNDFIRGESLKLKADCESLGRPLVFVDIESDDKKIGHVHNVSYPDLPESQLVNSRMIEFMNQQ